jgi:hypothetical protein
MYLPVTIANRGYNYVTALTPLPAPGSTRVSYMAQGSWYTLQDDGTGSLRGVSGSGVLNNQTGSLVITCGALPDAGSSIIINWAQPIEYTSRQALTGIETPAIEHTVAGGSINPGSLSISWLSGGVLKTVTDDGSGGITPTNIATGSVLYAKGKFTIRPVAIPDAGTTFTVNSHTYAKQLENIASSSGTFSFTLADFPIKPGSLSFSVNYACSGYSTTLFIKDDGAGHLTVSPYSLGYAIGHPQEQASGSSGGTNDQTADSWGSSYVQSAGGSTDINPMPTPGTINYTTGEGVLHGTGSGTIHFISRTQNSTVVIEV